MRLATLLVAMLAVLTVAQRATGQEFANPMPSVRADAWPSAEAAVASYLDPVARKLVTYFRVLASGAATVAEIDAFTAENPNWPNFPQLDTRRDEALAGEADDTAALADCRRRPPIHAPAQLRCASAELTAGQGNDAIALARAAWTGTGITDPGHEGAFMDRWGAAITPDDQWARFQAMAWSSQAVAARQVARLDAIHKRLAEARLALQHRHETALTLVAALPAGPIDPGLFLDRARYLRTGNRDSDALALWTADGVAAQQAAPDHAALFWAERNILARRLLHDGDAAGAYAVAAGAGADLPDPDLDALFLAGFVALRKLNDPDKATVAFTKLKDASPSTLTQSRAHYWLGRAAAAAGHDANQEYQEAAKYPLNFYGQLAATALGETPDRLAARIRALRDPAWTEPEAWQIVQSDLARAALLLVTWGEPRRADQFLLRADDVALSPGQRAAIAHAAAALDQPDMAVFIARRMGRDGVMLPDAGWPLAADPPDGRLDPAVALGIIRQESSFDAAALSPAGARGLMQLMPATAQAVARQLNESASAAALMADPAGNMRLGTAYLRSMLDQFGGALPLAVAAYNAGPHRVTEWLGDNGDPRAAGGPEMIDWIELIPFNETRNYVQRVLENVTVYRAKREEPAANDLAVAAR
jgi:soluble lytic murein transglycosylase